MGVFSSWEATDRNSSRTRTASWASPYRRAFSMATAARRASSSASSRSRGPYRRGDSLSTKHSAPRARPRARSGTTMAERTPTASHTRSASGLAANPCSISRVTSG